MTDWTHVTFNVLAVLGMLSAARVVQLTECDQINRTDAKWVRWLRRIGFVLAILALLYSVVNRDWVVSFPVLLLIIMNDGLLIINVLALTLRAPPSSDEFWKRNYPPTFLEDPSHRDQEFRSFSPVVIRLPKRTTYPRPL